MPTRLQGRYGLAVALALLGLCPEIVLSTAGLPLTTLVAHDLGSSPVALQLANGLSNAGYAFGAVLAAQLAQRFVQRRLFLAYEALFVLGSVLAATAPVTAVFFAARLVQGTAAGLMLIAALPPLVTRFGVARLPLSVVIVNVGLFGASTVGPIVGGVAGSVHGWRWMFWAAALAGALGCLAAWLGYERFDPVDPDLPFDRPAVGLALLATVLTFTAGSLLVAVPFTSPVFWVPLAGGLLLIWLLVRVERRKERPLMPIEALSSQLPVTGIVVAMVGGAAFTTMALLLQTSLQEVGHQAPLSVAGAFWPAPVGLLVAATAFGLLFRTRWLPVLDAGLACLVVAAALMLLVGASRPAGWTLVATLLLGFGAGATVSPGLFLAGFGVPSRLLGRAFALVQLFRSEATFAVAPLVVALAALSHDPAAGLRLGFLVTLVLAAVGLLTALLLPAVSGARLRTPDLAAWLEAGEQAMVSPTTAVHLRRGLGDESAEPLLPRRDRR